MSTYLTQDEINSIINEIKIEQNEKRNLEKKIKQLDKSIKNKEDILFKYCNHSKEIDRTYYGERTQYYCSICSQYL